jgi:hypothetical protein
MDLLPTYVETYSGYKRDEYPLAFWVDGQRLSVIEIEDRWYSPGRSYFRVFADDAGRYILCRDDDSFEWMFTRLS